MNPYKLQRTEQYDAWLKDSPDWDRTDIYLDDLMSTS